jgi:hypothetical protein
MNATKRHQGRKIRQVLRLHREWLEACRTGGRTESARECQMGQANRMGLGPDMERARRRETTRVMTA